MKVKYFSIDGELVSEDWFIFLTAARQAGVKYHINEGHRTFARQLYFWNCYKSGKCNNGNLAAFPSNNAPHIRTGREDHAIDSDDLQNIINYGRQNIVTISRTVPGESWHGEANAKQLAEFAKAHRWVKDKYAVLSDWERKAVSKLFYHRKKMKQHKSGNVYLSNLIWARWWKARLLVRANLLYRLGKSQGWGKLDRGKRQAILRSIINNGKP